VGRGITSAVVAAVLALTASLAVHAAGLGRLTVLSPIGQPLNAEIEIVALKPGEEDTLSARIAPLEAFEAAGIEPSAMLNSVRFAIERRDTRRILRVTTLQAVNEPFVELLVELQSQHGRLVREYTFLLDPAEYKARDAQAAARAAKPSAPAPAALPPLEPAKPAPGSEAAPPPPLVAAPAPAAAAEPDKPAAAEPEKPAAAAAPEKPAPAIEEKPVAEAAKEPAKEEAQPLLADDASAYEVMKGDTLAKIAGDRLPPGITLNQMLVAIYRSNQEAFIRENLNLVRAGRILNIPSSEDIGTVNVDEANRVVRAHMAEFREYRARLGAAPAVADAAAGQRDASGQIETKPEAPKPATVQDQVRLAKADPQQPSAGAAAAARGDDLAARDRALKEAQSRVADLEKNVADLQKLLELKNQQLAEVEKRGAPKPAAAPATSAPAPTPAPVAQAPEKPAAPAPAATPAAAPAPVAQAPVTPQPPAAAQPAKPAAKKVAAPPPPPEPSLLDEFLENPVALAGLAGVLVLLLAYAMWAWRKKKSAQAKFQDSVIGAAAAGAGMSEPSLDSAAPAAAQAARGAPSPASPGEEVDPIAEADVYMAYGRDAQAEEILKEALQKDGSRVPVHAKLLEIYAKRKDTKAFEQTAAKLKSLTNGAGSEWDKAAALGKSIDPTNGLYAGAAVAAAAVAAVEMSAPSGSAPALDFDIGGATQASAAVPDFSLDVPATKSGAGVDFDISGVTTKKDEVAEDTVVPIPRAPEKDAGLDFNLDLGTPAAPETKSAVAAAAGPAADAGLSFDLNLDLGGDTKSDSAAVPDFSGLSLDLDAADGGAATGSDPKWQEIATKLDLAKAYEEMGDKDGARELLNEVMKDGDAAQKGQAEQLLVKLA
jgi:pilus assembly protein FimV